MNSLESSILREIDEEPVETPSEKSRSSFETPWMTAPSAPAASPSKVSGPKPDSTFPTPPSASRCLPSAWSAGQSYYPVSSDRGDVKLPSPWSDQRNLGLHDVALTGPHAQTGYLLQCEGPDQDNSIRDWTGNMISTASALYEVRQLSSTDPCFEDVTDSHLHAKSGPNISSFDSDDDSASSSTGSSTISLPSPRSTSLSTPIEALPTFMSPVETIKPCPQYCRCHGYPPISLDNNPGNLIYPMPDLLHNTTPDQFSSMTSSTTCMTSPLICPAPFQPPSTSFKPSRPGFVDDGGRYSASSISTGSLSLVKSAPVSSEIKSAPNGQGGAYPLQVVPSAWLTSLFQEGHVDKDMENELITPTTASTITNSASERELTQAALPTSSSLNCEQESLPRDLITSTATADNQQSYPRPHHAPIPTEFPAYNSYMYPPPEYPSSNPPVYSNHSPFGYHPHPKHGDNAASNLGYHAHSTQMYPTQPPPGYHNSIFFSRLASRSFPPYGDRRVEKLLPVRFSSHGDGRPRTADGDRRKVAPDKRRPNRPGRRLVDQFPDLLPVIAWCINYSQATTSSSHSSSKPCIAMNKIHEIVIECIPGIKERGGIALSTIKKLVREVKRKERNKDFSDRVGATKAPTASEAQSLTQLSSQAISAESPEAPEDSISHSVVKINAERLKGSTDSISSAIMKDDSQLPRAPKESILRSVMELVENMPKADKDSRSTTTTRGSLTTRYTKMSHRRKLDYDGQQQAGANTASVSSYYDDTHGGSIFRLLMDAHNITEDEVKPMSSTSDKLCASSSACINSSIAQSHVKSSHFQSDIAAADERVDVANDPAKCNDDTDDDILVIDESSQNI